MKETHHFFTVFIVSQIVGYLVIPIDFLADGALLSADKRKLQSDFSEELKKKCISNLLCDHGECDTKTGLCHCFDGWSGRQCDIRKSRGLQSKIASTDRSGPSDTSGPRDRSGPSDRWSPRDRSGPSDKSGPSGKSSPSDTSGRVETNALPNGFQKNENNRLMKSLLGTTFSKTKLKVENVLQETVQDAGETKQRERSERDAIEEELQEPSEELNRHTCRTGYKRPKVKDRMCLPGFICTFGTCSSKKHSSYIAFQCICDKGAIGIFCEHKCCLDCGQHGKCMLYANGTEYCDCAFNYHGEKCQLAKIAGITGQATSLPSEKMPVVIIVGMSVISAVLLLAVVFLMLILRDRVCRALWIITPNCKHAHNCTQAHPRIAEDAVVYYHGELPPHQVTCLSFSPLPHPLPLLTNNPDTRGGVGTSMSTTKFIEGNINIDDSSHYNPEPS